MADLSGLLNPRSIAFVGGKRARLAADQTRQFGFSGPVWEVNPSGEYPTLSDLPGVPDAVFLGVPAEAAVAVMTEAASLGVKGVVAYPAEFAEAGYLDRQAQLVDAANGVPFIGPNCHGYVNARNGAVLWPDVHGCERVEQGVAIITQSGNVAIDLTMQQRGLPLAMVITLGNQASADLVDCLEAMVADPDITAIGIHIEGLTDSVRFAAACRAAHAAGKGIVVLKTGQSDQGAVIANTHTASLAGSSHAHEALFDRGGAAQVHTPEALVGALSVLHTSGALAGPKAVSLSCSGGEASLMADLSESSRLEFPAFSHAAREALDAILDGKVALENPFDYHTFIWGDTERMTACFTTAVSDGADVGVLVIDFPAPGRDRSDWWPTVDAFAASIFSSGDRWHCHVHAAGEPPTGGLRLRHQQGAGTAAWDGIVRGHAERARGNPARRSPLRTTRSRRRPSSPRRGRSKTTAAQRGHLGTRRARSRFGGCSNSGLKAWFSRRGEVVGGSPSNRGRRRGPRRAGRASRCTRRLHRCTSSATDSSLSAWWMA